MQYFATFTSPTEEEALQIAERAGDVFGALVTDKVIGGFNSPAYVLPSLARQQARRAVLPDPLVLKVRLQQALSNLPIQAKQLEGFVRDVESTRSKTFLKRSDLAGTSAALLYDSLMIKRESDYLVLLPLRPPDNESADRAIDFQKINSALESAGLSKVVLIDLLEETSSLFENYLQEAKFLSGIGFLSIVLLLLISLRSLARTVRVVVPLACSVLCVTALLVATGTALTIFHLIGLLLVVAVGSNYALFFDGSTYSEMESSGSQMQVSLLVANLTTVGSFGILGLSRIPVLNAIGITVGIGAFLALVFSAILARPSGVRL
jgi:predicted exporter